VLCAKSKLAKSSYSTTGIDYWAERTRNPLPGSDSRIAVLRLKRLKVALRRLAFGIGSLGQHIAAALSPVRNHAPARVRLRECVEPTLHGVEHFS
jgi:hypothetical protein